MKTVDTITMGNHRNVTVFISIFSTLLCALSLLLRFSGEINQKTQNLLSPEVLQANVAATILDHNLYLITIELLNEAPQIAQEQLQVATPPARPLYSVEKSTLPKESATNMTMNDFEVTTSMLVQRVMQALHSTYPDDDTYATYSEILTPQHSQAAHTNDYQTLLHQNIITHSNQPSLSQSWLSPSEANLTGFPKWRTILRESPRPTLLSTV